MLSHHRVKRENPMPEPRPRARARMTIPDLVAPESPIAQEATQIAQEVSGKTNPDQGLIIWTMRMKQAAAEWRRPAQQRGPDDDNPLAREAKDAARSVSDGAEPDREMVIFAMRLLQSIYDWRSRKLRR